MMFEVIQASTVLFIPNTLHGLCMIKAGLFNFNIFWWAVYSRRLGTIPVMSKSSLINCKRHGE